MTYLATRDELIHPDDSRLEWVTTAYCSEKCRRSATLLSGAQIFEIDNYEFDEICGACGGSVELIAQNQDEYNALMDSWLY